METKACIARCKLVNFPDYFKSELMETLKFGRIDLRRDIYFPDYFKSELMETIGVQMSCGYCNHLSRLLQIGINGNDASTPLKIRFNFPDYFKSELMET